MTHEERAFRRGLQHGYQLAVIDALAGATAQDMRERDRAIQEWRNTGPDRFPPDMPRRPEPARPRASSMEKQIDLHH